MSHTPLDINDHEVIQGWKVWHRPFEGWWHATRDGEHHADRSKAVVLRRAGIEEGDDC
jgi:hypothetical protein